MQDWQYIYIYIHTCNTHTYTQSMHIVKLRSLKDGNSSLLTVTGRKSKLESMDFPMKYGGGPANFPLNQSIELFEWQKEHWCVFLGCVQLSSFRVLYTLWNERGLTTPKQCATGKQMCQCQSVLCKPHESEIPKKYAMFPWKKVCVSVCARVHMCARFHTCVCTYVRACPVLTMKIKFEHKSPPDLIRRRPKLWSLRILSRRCLVSQRRHVQLRFVVLSCTLHDEIMYSMDLQTVDSKVEIASEFPWSPHQQSWTWVVLLHHFMVIYLRKCWTTIRYFG